MAAPSSRKKVARFEAQTAILEAALQDLAKNGPAAVSPQEICERLDVSKALVNYHFGGRDGLIAQAMALGYERYVEVLWEAASAAGEDPVDRLMAWIDRQIDWTCENPGLSAALDFPTFVTSVPANMPADVTYRMTTCAYRNFTNLQVLVADARKALQKAKPRRKSAEDPLRVPVDSALIGWTTLGLSVWLAGRHLPSQDNSPLYASFVSAARKHLRNLVLSLLSA